MDCIEDIEVVPCGKSSFVHPYRVLYKQDGSKKLWDCIRQHNSVAVLLFNVTQNAFVLVKQFRPAVYMMSNTHMWSDSPALQGGLSWKGGEGEGEGPQQDPKGQPPAKKSSSVYGPASQGMTYELCAGIVDKPLPLEQIVAEEIEEETGYQVPASSVQPITSYNSSVGVAGSCQWLYYAEVEDSMRKGRGGGSDLDQEMIEVVHLPLSESEAFVFDASKAKTSGLSFAFFWFNQYKKPFLQATTKQ